MWQSCPCLAPLSLSLSHRAVTLVSSSCTLLESQHLSRDELTLLSDILYVCMPLSVRPSLVQLHTPQYLRAKQVCCTGTGFYGVLFTYEGGTTVRVQQVWASLSNQVFLHQTASPPNDNILLYVGACSSALAVVLSLCAPAFDSLQLSGCAECIDGSRHVYSCH